MTWTDDTQESAWNTDTLIDGGGGGGGGGGGRSCHVCGNEDHIARECPNKPSNKCYKCDQEGHISRDCPNATNDGDSRACRICNETGHFARDCPSTTCRKCNQAGHRSRDCPSGVPDKCYNCHQEGHLSRDCLEERRERKPMTCHRCSQEGHRASECVNEPVERVDDEGKPIPSAVTYIPSEEEVTDATFDMLHYNEANLSRFEQMSVTVSDPQFEIPISSFEEAQLLPNLMHQLQVKMRFTTPTPIQKFCIPIILAGRDVIACSQTGSGKSGAFILPILQQLMSDPELPPRETIRGKRTQTPLVVVLSPTRELCLQLYEHFRLFSEEETRRIGVSPAYGGTQVRYNAEQIRSGTHVLCAVPGRLKHFVDDGTVSFAKVRYFVLDEADRMLDEGFSEAIRSFHEHETMVPKENRQTLMFSATFSKVEDLARQMMRPDTVKVVVGILGGVNNDVVQEFIETADIKAKRQALKTVLDEFFANELGETAVQQADSPKQKVIVFVEKKKIVDTLASFVTQTAGYGATSIHGDRDQQQREEALRAFRDRRFLVLVASEVAARGLDIKGVGMVVNFDLPKEIDQFVHRVGRTGRVGTRGRAVSFFDETRDSELAPYLVKVLDECGQPVPEFISRAASGNYGENFLGTADDTNGGAGDWQNNEWGDN